MTNDSLTIIVPTRNEAQNVNPLLDRVEASIGMPVTVLFVDDSTDGTPWVIGLASSVSRRFVNVELLHREIEDRVGGLGGAVAAGIAQSTSEYVCVMDGDLQHPPEYVVDLYKAARQRSSDLVVASRRVPGGHDEGLSAFRSLISHGSALAGKIMFPRALRDVTDPMSGFFLLRREAVHLERLNPRGFKLLLELLVKHPEFRRTEVPFTFVERVAGESKGTFAEGLRYGRLLLEMRLGIAA
jgi:dolichol-phosphate mannosyltransferase